LTDQLPPGHNSRVILYILVALLAAAIFTADRLIHAQIAFPVLYIAVVLITTRFWSSRRVLWVSAGCIGLTALGFLVKVRSAPLAALINTLIAVVAIGLTTLLVMRSQSAKLLHESESRYRYIFQAAGVSIWEIDFSRVKIAIDDLKTSGVRDFAQYLAAHPEFVERTNKLLRIGDVNDATVKLFGSKDKKELLQSLDKIFTPEAELEFAGELLAIAEGRSSFETKMLLKTLTGVPIWVIFRVTFPPRVSDFNRVLISMTDVTAYL
jgi:PAS domain-containing protein